MGQAQHDHHSAEDAEVGRLSVGAVVVSESARQRGAPEVWSAVIDPRLRKGASAMTSPRCALSRCRDASSHSQITGRPTAASAAALPHSTRWSADG